MEIVARIRREEIHDAHHHAECDGGEKIIIAGCAVKLGMAIVGRLSKLRITDLRIAIKAET